MLSAPFIRTPRITRHKYGDGSRQNHEHNELYSDPKQVRKLKSYGIALAKVLLQRKLESAPQNLGDVVCQGAPDILKKDVKARGEMLARLMRENLDNTQDVKATIEDIAAMSNSVKRKAFP